MAGFEVSTEVHNFHTFVPPPPSAVSGRRVEPATLRLGYTALMRVTGGPNVLKEIGRGGVSLQNIAAARKRFLRYAPASWRLIFPSAKGNDARQRCVPLPSTLGDVQGDRRRQACARSLWEMGMEPAIIAELVGYVPSERELEGTRLTTVRKRPDIVARQQAGRLRRRPNPEDSRTSYQERRAAGRCVDCGVPALHDRSRCEQHLNESKARMAKHRGPVVCLRCRKEISEADRQHGRRYHLACHGEKERERRATPEVRARSRRLTREYEKRHRNLGLCLKCSAKIVPGNVLCERHGRRKVTEQQAVETH